MKRNPLVVRIVDGIGIKEQENDRHSGNLGNNQ